MDERSSMAALTERLRPRRYDEIVGQDGAKRLLRRLAAERDPQRRGRSVLLHGPDGVGKSTLADLYAAAVLCLESGDSDGEACGRCRDCELRLKGQHTNLLVVDDGEVRTGVMLERITSAYGSYAWSMGWLVIVIDRADRMPREHWDALHRRLERTAAGVSFVLTVSDLQAAPRRSRELLTPIAVHALSLPEREILLRGACATEGIEIDDAGLRALSWSGGGRARSLLNSLESLAFAGPITEVSVLAHFRDSRADAGLEYLERVLARESLSRQLHALDDAGLAPNEASEAVRGVVAAAFGAPALGLESEQLPARYQASLAGRQLWTAMLERGNELNLTPRQMFARLMNWWSEPVADRAGLIDRLNGFDEFLNGASSPKFTITAIAPAPRRRRTAADLRRLADESSAATRRGVRSTSSSQWLADGDVRRVWDAASFLIQRHGLFLNRRMSLCFGPRGNEAEVTKELTDLLNQMRLWVNRHWQTSALSEPLHWVRVHSLDEAGARWVQIAVSAPPVADLEPWIRHFRAKKGRDPLKCATKVEFDFSLPRTGMELDRHLDLLSVIVHGCDPLWKAKGLDEGGGGGKFEPVHKLLGVEYPHPVGPPWAKQRTFVSRYIDGEYRNKAAAVLPALSIFDEHAVWAARSGWEPAEFKYRRTCEDERRRLIQAFERDWPRGDLRFAERRAAEWQTIEDSWRDGLQLRMARRPGISSPPIRGHHNPD